ncbi:MAG: DUF4178 domain-containing protein [Cyclobacteriaceae bacterium]
MFNNPFKKKKEPEYDVTNLSIKDLETGFIFDYDMKSWVVEESYEYDWGNNNFSREYKVNSGDEVAFLNVEDDGELNLSMVKAIKIRAVEEDLMDEIVKKKTPPKQIHYQKELYFLENDAAGYFRDSAKKTEDWEELLTWEYYNEEEDKLVCITQWDDHNIDASAGLVLNEHQVSEIIPGQ